MNKAKKAILVGLISTVSFLFSSVASANQYYKELTEYFEDVFRGEAFLPVPYGADNRFQPKSIWVRLDNLSAKLDSARTQKGWVFASTGKMVFTDTIVETSNSPITLPTEGIDKDRKIAIALALAGGAIPEVQELMFKADYSSNMEYSIRPGNTQVEYIPIADGKVAQQINAAQLRALENAIDSMKGVIGRKIVLAAIRAKDAEIKVELSSGLAIEAKTTIIKVLQSLGFSFATEAKKTAVLELKDWRYIGFQSIVTKKDLKISTGESDRNLDPNEFVTPAEQLRVEEGPAQPGT